MATEAQIRANRLNAMRSTGPRTEAGKARSRLNATKHGLAASQPEQAGEAAPSKAAPAKAGLGQAALSAAIVEALPQAAALPLVASAFVEATLQVARVRTARTQRLAMAWFTDVSSPAEGEQLARDLLRLDRYERRALSRREGLLRQLDARSWQNEPKSDAARVGGSSAAALSVGLS